LKISVFGLCVSTVSAGCLAYQGHEVIGVDPVGMKTDLINRGWSPIVEHYCPVEHFGDPCNPQLWQDLSANSSLFGLNSSEPIFGPPYSDLPARNK
jgi:hypothetical protein